MTRYLIGILFSLGLASCGADGMPSTPEPRETKNEAEGPVDMMEPAS